MPIVAPYFQFGNWKYGLSAEFAVKHRTKLYDLNHKERPLERSIT
jgi:hypothetical protein